MQRSRGKLSAYAGQYRSRTFAQVEVVLALGYICGLRVWRRAPALQNSQKLRRGTDRNAFEGFEGKQVAAVARSDEVSPASHGTLEETIIRLILPDDREASGRPNGLRDALDFTDNGCSLGCRESEFVAQDTDNLSENWGRDNQLDDACPGQREKVCRGTTEENRRNVHVRVKHDTRHLLGPAAIVLNDALDIGLVPDSCSTGRSLPPAPRAAPAPRGNVFTERFPEKLAPSSPLFLGKPFRVFQEAWRQRHGDNLGGTHLQPSLHTKYYS
jgi:hypothetical protein